VVDDEGLDPEIAAHYAAVPERERLADAGNLERVRTWALLAVEAEPSLLGASPHLLAIAGR
jgi:hypothetical protein